MFAWNVAHVSVSCILECCLRAQVLGNCRLECNRNYNAHIDTVISMSPRDDHRVMLPRLEVFDGRTD